MANLAGNKAPGERTGRRQPSSYQELCSISGTTGSRRPAVMSLQPDRDQPTENQTPDPISPKTLGQWPRGRGIAQFMWGYQSPFRISVEVRLRTELEEIGLAGRIDVLLVGFEVAGQHTFPICIEPEDGPYDPSALANVMSRARELYDAHPDRDMIHTHPGVHEEFHTELLQKMVGSAIEGALVATETGANKEFFVGLPVQVQDYDVYVVISIEREALAKVPRLQTEMGAALSR